MMMQRAWLLRTRNLPGSFDSYPILYLQALLLFGQESDAELGAMSTANRDELDYLFQDIEPRKVGKAVTRPLSYDAPVYTGDPVADEWEAAIARGEVPDLEAHPAKPLRR